VCGAQVVQAKRKVANGAVFNMAVKLSQGNMPDQMMQARPLSLL
jgi:hypothetical protein